MVIYGRGGGQVVNMLAFPLQQLELKSLWSQQFFSTKFVFEKNGNYQKRGQGRSIF